MTKYPTGPHRTPPDQLRVTRSQYYDREFL